MMLPCLLNGQAVVAGMLPSMQFGDGLFETIAIIQGQPCLWPQHMARLQLGCARLAYPHLDVDKLLQEALQLAIGQTKAVVKIIVAPASAGRGYQRANPIKLDQWVQLHPWPDLPLYSKDVLANIQLCQTCLGKQPLLAGIKHLNRLEQILARAELAENIHEGVMLDQDGFVVEGTMSNLLLGFGGHYVTPSIQDCGVAGVVRALVLEQAKQTISVRQVKPDELVQADQLFIMNALLGIRPVARFGQHTYATVCLPADLQPIHANCFLPSFC